MATSRMKSKINWDKSSGNEWSFTGEGSYFKEAEVQEFINSFFSEEELYIVIDRHNAHELPKQEAGRKVKGSLKNQDITLCNKAFSKMVEFSYIGVAKHGVINN